MPSRPWRTIQNDAAHSVLVAADRKEKEAAKTGGPAQSDLTLVAPEAAGAGKAAAGPVPPPEGTFMLDIEQQRRLMTQRITAEVQEKPSTRRGRR